MPADDESGDPPAPSAVARARRLAGRSVPEPGRPTPRRRGAPQPGVTFGPPPAADNAEPTDPTGPIERTGPIEPPGTTAAPAEPARKSRAGRNLPAAIGVGLGLGAVIIASLFLYRPSFAFIVAAAVL